jgi:hypothetical protein
MSTKIYVETGPRIVDDDKSVQEIEILSDSRGMFEFCGSLWIFLDGLEVFGNVRSDPGKI